MKQDCPYCGKVGIDGRHINMCQKNPKNLVVEDVPHELVPVIAENVTSELIAPTGAETLNCPTCGAKSIMLNAIDYRCPNCGDREKRQPLPAGVK